jgi:hypothetical protein
LLVGAAVATGAVVAAAVAAAVAAGLAASLEPDPQAVSETAIIDASAILLNFVHFFIFKSPCL